MTEVINKCGTAREVFIAWIARHFMFIMTVVSLLGYSLAYLEGGLGQPIRADGAGYYAYLPAVLIYGDPSLEAVAQQQYGGVFPVWTHVFKDASTGRYLNTYNMGMAVMMAPFFLMAHLLTWIFQSPPGGFAFWRFNYPLNGYSLFYQHAAGLAGLFYCLAGLSLLKSVLIKYFSMGIVIVSLMALFLGTSLFDMTIGDSVMSHPYTFFLTAALLNLTPRWYEHSSSLKPSILIGLILGGLILVRILNIFFLPLFFLYAVTSWRDLADRLMLLFRLRKALLWTGLIAVVVFVPQVLYWKYTTGHFLVNAYRDYLRFGAPHLTEVFLGLRKGLLVWFPILVLAFTGLFRFKTLCRDWFWPVIIVWVLYSLTVSRYFIWWGGGGFGNRYFMDTWALTAFPLAAVYAGTKTRISRVFIALISVICILYTLFLMKLYFTREIPHDGLDAQAFFDIFWLRGKWALSLFAH